MNDGVERVVVSIKQIGKNFKEIIYKHKIIQNRNSYNYNQLKARLEDSKDLNNLRKILRSTCEKSSKIFYRLKNSFRKI